MAVEKPELDGPARDQDGDVTAQDLLGQLDDAIDEVRAFMQDWHRAIVCGKPVSKSVTAENSHAISKFGAWVVANAEAGLIRQPAFEDLGKAHRQVYDQARRLALSVANGQSIKTVEYDALINQLSRFYDQSRRLRDAFRKLVSEIDPLTGLHNRQVMNEELSVEFSRGRRTDGPLCIALTDKITVRSAREKTLAEITRNRILWTKTIDELMDVVHAGREGIEHFIWFDDIDVKMEGAGGNRSGYGSLKAGGHSGSKDYDQVSNFLDDIEDPELSELMTMFAKPEPPEGRVNDADEELIPSVNWSFPLSMELLSPEQRVEGRSAAEEKKQ